MKDLSVTEAFRARLDSTIEEDKDSTEIRVKIIEGVFKAYGRDSLPPEDLSYAIYTLGTVFMGLHEDEEELARVFSSIVESSRKIKEEE